MSDKRVTLFQDNTAGTLQGTIYRKQIVRFGNWVDPFDPQDTMVLDEDLAKKFQKNFIGKVIDRVPVPLNHTDDVSANTGELVKLEIASDGIYGYLDIRDEDTVQDIEKGLVFDVSISFDWDYVDTETGKHWGPTLLHVALVNNPYLVHMKGFEKVSDAAGSFANQIKTALGLAQNRNTSAIMLSESKVKELRAMKLSKVRNDREFEVTIKVKGDDGVEVDKLLKVGEEVEIPEDQLEAVKAQITDAVDPNAEDDKGGDDQEEDQEDKGGEDKDADVKKELSRAQAKLAEYETEKLYSTLLSKGKITPAQKDRFMALANANAGAKVTSLSKDGKKVTVSLAKAVASVLNAGPVIANLNNEAGSGKGDDNKGEGDNNGADKKPSENLSDSESKGLQAVGASPARLDELSEKYPEMKSTLNKLDESKGDK